VYHLLSASTTIKGLQVEPSRHPVCETVAAALTEPAPSLAAISGRRCHSSTHSPHHRRRRRFAEPLPPDSIAITPISATTRSHAPSTRRRLARRYIHIFQQPSSLTCFCPVYGAFDPSLSPFIIFQVPILIPFLGHPRTHDSTAARFYCDDFPPNLMSGTRSA
jgi:hypothetical protein